MRRKSINQNDKNVKISRQGYLKVIVTEFYIFKKLRYKKYKKDLNELIQMKDTMFEIKNTLVELMTTTIFYYLHNFV